MSPAAPHRRLPAAWRLRGVMMADHAEISDLFDDVTAAFRSGNRDEAAAMFEVFEKRLEAHLTAEEREMFPALAVDHPAEAAALAADHQKIRARVAELGVCVDLHLARADWIDELVSLLREHAAREDGLLYRWVGEPGSHVDPQAVLRRLAAV
ncbi:MAG TPA: hemerythrin domain-containing protein [Kofleriaceae bacterium]|nr:hemerythrin domain-containing protein [Kofleriaceae bacterium]